MSFLSFCQDKHTTPGWYKPGLSLKFVSKMYRSDRNFLPGQLSGGTKPDGFPPAPERAGCGRMKPFFNDIALVAVLKNDKIKS
ncbi:hypothetical protein K8352_11500 [Flavobacteriaceae bacterium F89]|uniref:Uncharacterized protein n=1 Tax=Cerina litoralis TaxID=2874477 RepID=A0AAE3EXG0_9FLAO|nr:hypothetical protein [Cerina litoralis]